MVHVDAKDFAEESVHVLPVTLRILLRARVTHAEVKISVRAELNASARMILSDANNF